MVPTVRIDREEEMFQTTTTTMAHTPYYPPPFPPPTTTRPSSPYRPRSIPPPFVDNTPVCVDAVTGEPCIPIRHRNHHSFPSAGSPEPPEEPSAESIMMDQILFAVIHTHWPWGYDFVRSFYSVIEKSSLDEDSRGVIRNALLHASQVSANVPFNQ